MTPQRPTEFAYNEPSPRSLGVRKRREVLGPSPAVDRNNPGASYNGVIAPIAGLSIKGAIFYQGIDNAVGGDAPHALYWLCQC
jgi:hypothetical protein